MRTCRILALLAVVAVNPSSVKAAIPTPPQNVQPAWIYEGPATYARLTWNAVEDATSYNVYRQNTENSGWFQLKTGVTNLMYFDYDAISAPKSYFVTAVNSDGESAASESVTAMDGEAFPIRHYPPSLLPDWDHEFGWVLPTSAQIIWYLQTISGADGMLEFGDSATNMGIVYFQPGYQMFGHGMTLTNLTPATPYYYRITSVYTNRAGYSELFSLTTPDTNHPPVAGDVSFGPIIDPWEQPISIPGSDLESNTFSLTARIINQPTNGTVSAPFYSGYSGIFLVHYQPNPGARGGDFFQYVINDGEFDSSPGTVTITNVWLNQTPQPASFDTNSLEDIPMNLALAVYDADGDAITFEGIGCAYGTVTGTAPNFVYIPATNFTGLDTIYYFVTDSYSGGFAQGAINITVNPVNDAPIVWSEALESAEDTPLNIGLYATDVEGDPISVFVASEPTHGTLSGTVPNLTYTPNANFVGTDYFTYRAADGMATSAVATVTIIVTPVNDPPLTFNASAEVTEDRSITVTLPATDAEGDALAFLVVTPPAHGTAVRAYEYYAPNRWTYTPQPNYHGPDSFTFVATDGLVTSAPATFSFTVQPVNDPPDVAPQYYSTLEDAAISAIATASDADGEPLTFNIATAPSHGTITGTGPDYLYTPAPNYNGPDYFTFTATDPAGVFRTAPIYITVLPTPDVPIAHPQSVTTSYNTPISFFLSASDPGGDIQSFSVVTSPAGGTLAGAGNWKTFTPDTGFSGNTSFDFRASDSQVAVSAPATVTITVQGPTSTPVAPSGLVATAISSSRIDLSWIDNAGNGEDGFKVERSLNGNSWTQIATLGPSVTGFAATGLSANKTYYFRVRAFNILGNSAYSNTASAKTPR